MKELDFYGQIKSLFPVAKSGTILIIEKHLSLKKYHATTITSKISLFILIK